MIPRVLKQTTAVAYSPLVVSFIRANRHVVNMLDGPQQLTFDYLTRLARMITQACKTRMNIALSMSLGSRLS
jgi:hypothetical protein